VLAIRELRSSADADGERRFGDEHGHSERLSFAVRLAPTSGDYGNCLTSCKAANNNTCIVTGCGQSCESYGTIAACPDLLAAPTCEQQCYQTNNVCTLTTTGCNFVPGSGLHVCLSACNVTLPNTTCAKGIDTAICLNNPCTNATCAANPSATCIASVCGGCTAQWALNGAAVTCDLPPPQNPCKSLGCGDCVNNNVCQFCGGAYTSAAAVQANVGFCFAASDASSANLCVGAAAIVSACPVVSNGTGSGSGASTGTNSSSVDPTQVQNSVAQLASNQSISSKYIIIVLLVINETASGNANGNNVTISMFVTLNGDAQPQASDLAQVCPILDSALIASDSSIPSSLLTCALNPRSSTSGGKKRQSQSYNYVATMTYPGTSQSSTSGNPIQSSAAMNALSFITAALALALALFA